MIKHAVIGSREGVAPQTVSLKVSELFEKHGEFILVSGGGPNGSVNFVAEQTALEFGIPVLSFRPKRLPDYNFDPQYGVEEWRLHRGKGNVILHDISFADWSSAAHYRSLLIVERAAEATALRNAGWSPGTDFEIEMFTNAGKPVEVVKVG